MLAWVQRYLQEKGDIEWEPTVYSIVRAVEYMQKWRGRVEQGIETEKKGEKTNRQKGCEGKEKEVNKEQQEGGK